MSVSRAPSNPSQGCAGRHFDGALSIPVTSKADPLQLITRGENEWEETLGHACRGAHKAQQG